MNAVSSCSAASAMLYLPTQALKENSPPKSLGRDAILYSTCTHKGGTLTMDQPAT